MAEFLLWLTK